MEAFIKANQNFMSRGIRGERNYPTDELARVRLIFSRVYYIRPSHVDIKAEDVPLNSAITRIYTDAEQNKNVTGIEIYR